MMRRKKRDRSLSDIEHHDMFKEYCREHRVHEFQWSPSVIVAQKIADKMVEWGKNLKNKKTKEDKERDKWIKKHKKIRY